jgi:parallel beta-helix repeat protein
MSENGFENCIVNCEGDSLDPHRGFSFRTSEDTASVLQGFTIQNGYVLGDAPFGSGGAIFCDASSPQIRGNRIVNNFASEEGGGIQCGGQAAPIISDNQIVDNLTNGFGAGIQCNNASPTIRGNTIEGNIAISSGGGINCWMNAAPTIVGNVITDNQTIGGVGGGISSGSSSPSIEGNILRGNFSYDRGGGILCHNSIAVIVGNIIMGNRSNNMGGGIACGDSASVVLLHSILWEDSAGSGAEIFVDSSSSIMVSYSDVEGGWPGEGNIDVDPLFRDNSTGDYHLMATACGDPDDSPCIDAAHPDSLDAQLDCDHGLGSTRCDIGAYGGRGNGPPVSVETPFDSYTRQIPLAFGLQQNYPNPFNPSTTIGLHLAGAPGIKQHVQLTVYDLRGRRVKELVNSEFAPGTHKVHWDGRDERGRSVASGIYLYTLKAGEESFTRKMMVLK